MEDRRKDYRLALCFRSFEGVRDKIKELPDNPWLKAETKAMCIRLIKNECDLTGFMVRFIEEWPEGFSKVID